MGNVCGSSCRCCVFVSVVHPVAILNAVFCVIYSLLIFVSDASGNHMVETYSSMGLVMALCVASIVSFCFPYYNNHLYSHKQLHVHGTYKALCTKLQLH